MDEVIELPDYDAIIDCFIAEPESWQECLTAIVQIELEKSPAMAIVDFMNSVLQKSQRKINIPYKCRDAIAMLVWHSIPEERFAIQELRRILP